MVNIHTCTKDVKDIPENYPDPANGLLIGLNIKSAGERFAGISYTKFDQG
jgi:hypothetical protein